MRKMLLGLGCFILFWPTLVAAQSAANRLVFNRLEITLDEPTGALVRMADPATGVILESPLDLAGLINVTCAGRRLEPAGSKVEIASTDEGTTLTWKALGGELPKGGFIRAEVTIKAAPDGRSVILAARVKNESGAPVSQVLFPDLKGLRPLDDPEAVELRMALGAVNPFAHPVRPEGRARYYPPFIWQRFPFEPVYQMHALRWMDLGSLKSGLSIYQHKWIEEPVPSLVTRRLESDPQWLELAWQDTAGIAPGQAWQSGEFWLTPHEGGWAKGIEPYRQYVKRMNPPRPVPRRIREGLGFQTYWINTQSYKFIPQLARDAKANGIDEVCLWVWCNYGFLPVKHNPKLGTLEDLLGGIKAARELGVGVAPFTNMKNLDDSLAARYGVTPGTGANWAFDGGAPTSQNPLGAPSGQFDIDTRNPIWQKDVIAEFKRWADLGVTNFAWDVFQEYGSMGLVNTIKQARTYIRAKDPEGSFCAEPYLANLERVTQVADYTWNWLDYTEAGPYLATIRYPRLNCNVESDPRVVKMAFADGLYLNVMPKRPDEGNGTKLISEEPGLAAALKQCAALRRQFLDYFVEGNFLGESVLSRPVCTFVRQKKDGEIGGALYNSGRFEYPELFVRGHQLKNKLLVVVLNNAGSPREVTVPSRLSLWIPGAGQYRVTYYDGQGRKGREQTDTVAKGGEWTGRTEKLEPLEMAFFEIEALGAKARELPVEPTATPEPTPDPSAKAGAAQNLHAMVWDFDGSAQPTAGLPGGAVDGDLAAPEGWRSFPEGHSAPVASECKIDNGMLTQTYTGLPEGQLWPKEYVSAYGVGLIPFFPQPGTALGLKNITEQYPYLILSGEVGWSKRRPLGAMVFVVTDHGAWYENRIELGQWESNKPGRQVFNLATTPPRTGGYEGTMQGMIVVPFGQLKDPVAPEFMKDVWLKEFDNDAKVTYLKLDWVALTDDPEFRAK